MRLRNVHLGKQLRERLSNAFCCVTEASAEGAELELPGWRRPLRVSLRGVRLEFLQRTLPQVPAPYTPTPCTLSRIFSLPRRPCACACEERRRDSAAHRFCVATCDNAVRAMHPNRLCCVALLRKSLARSPGLLDA